MMEKELQALVEDLYRFRDYYFENHPIQEANLKASLVAEKLQECLEAMDKVPPGDEDEDSGSRAERLYLRGRALNVTNDYNPESVKLLSKSVKLKPSYVEAWNELGESYWKGNDIDNARNCFEGALAHRENKTSLRNISIVLRQKAFASNEERLKNIEEGLSKAREAVQLDASDGLSWSVMGNAYLAHFFSVSQNPRTLKLAMSAYKQAERDPVARSSPELHYNKAIALKFEEDYVGAFECFRQAHALDPTWNQPVQQEASLLKSLNEIQNLLANRGKLKNKKFNSLVKSVDAKHLGPLGTPQSVSTFKEPYEEVDFSGLTEGTNESKVILGKVICSVHSEESVAFTFCLTDRNSRCLAVNLYNLAPGKGVIIGDSVAIAEPNFRRVDITQKNQRIQFDLIRVDSPLVLIINGKKPSSNFQAGIELSTFTKSD